MKVISSLDDVKIDGQTVVALGNFDGVHIGHREILLSAYEKQSETTGHRYALPFPPTPAKR